MIFFLPPNIFSPQSVNISSVPTWCNDHSVPCKHHRWEKTTSASVKGPLSFFSLVIWSDRKSASQLWEWAKYGLDRSACSSQSCVCVGVYRAMCSSSRSLLSQFLAVSIDKSILCWKLLLHTGVILVSGVLLAHRANHNSSATSVPHLKLLLGCISCSDNQLK